MASRGRRGTGGQGRGRRGASDPALLAVVILGIVLTGLGWPIPRSAAFFVDADTTDASAATELLDAPTGLAASASGATVTLTWTASPDTGADGYQVRRAAAPGGPYTLVATVTPASATTTTDTPGSGTWYYVLATVAGSAPWSSSPGNEASVTVSTTTTTGFKGCGANAAVTSGSGDNDGFQTNAAEACDDDSIFAVDTNSGTNASALCTGIGKDRHRFWAFGLGVPTGASSIGGIQVRADLRADAASPGKPTVCVRLSWNGGTSWTAYKSLGSTLTTAETTYDLGGAADLWGRAWTGTELSDAAFRLEIVSVTSNTNRDLSLDGLKVQVTYTP